MSTLTHVSSHVATCRSYSPVLPGLPTSVVKCNIFDYIKKYTEQSPARVQHGSRSVRTPFLADVNMPVVRAVACPVATARESPLFRPRQRRVANFSLELSRLDSLH